MTLECAALGLVRARRGYGVPRERLGPGRLVLTPDELQLQDAGGNTLARRSRADLTRGWYCPALSQRTLDATDTLVPTWTQSGLPWLILATRDGRWVAASTGRDEAYALLDALGVGPRQRAWRAWLFLDRIPRLRDPRMPLWAGAFAADLAVWLVPSVLLTFFGSMPVLSSPPSFEAFCGAAAAVWLGVALARWASGFRHLRAEREWLFARFDRLRFVSPHLDSAGTEVALERLEAIRCGVVDVRLELRDATEPLRVTLRPLESVGNGRAEPALDDATRLAHAVFDWALATQEARARHRSTLERASARLAKQSPLAHLEGSSTPIQSAAYREAPLDEASLVLLATDLDTPAPLRAVAAATIRAQGSGEARARVEGALRTFR